MLQLSSPDKVLWTSAGITKQDLAAYYDSVADRLLPHLKDRPVTLHHHPRGVDSPGFLRKDLAGHAPDYVGRWTTWAHTAKRNVTYAIISNRQALRWCAGQNVTEFHTCMFRTDRPDRLDTVAIDLDPSPDSIDAASAALQVRAVLDDIGLHSSVKTSGGRGLHIEIPVERHYDAAALRRLAGDIATQAVRHRPGEMTTEFRIDDRAGALYLDCTRVGIGATLICAWSPRARHVATVATPLDWADVQPGMDLTVFDQTSAPSREVPDPIAPQRIERARRALDRLP